MAHTYSTLKQSLTTAIQNEATTDTRTRDLMENSIQWIDMTKAQKAELLEMLEAC